MARPVTFLYTQVPTQWSTKSLIRLGDGKFLKPASRISYRDLDAGMNMFFDSMFFITTSLTQEEHIAKLRSWSLYHAFIFNDSHICYFFENGLLKNHYEATDIEQIQSDNNANANLRDFDSIAELVYWLHHPSIGMSYAEYFLKYESLTQEKKDLILSFLYYTKDIRFVNLSYSLFHDIRKLWLIVSRVSILEAIIGHAPNCSGGMKNCELCQKKIQPHRNLTEKSWRAQFLAARQMSPETQQQYLTIINAAYDEIRHKTAHPSRLPTPQYPRIEGNQVYDIEKSIGTFGADTHALDSLVTRIQEVTRYLLINHVFDLAFFPPLGTTKATLVA